MAKEEFEELKKELEELKEETGNNKAFKIDELIKGY